MYACMQYEGKTPSQGRRPFFLVTLRGHFVRVLCINYKSSGFYMPTLAHVRRTLATFVGTCAAKTPTLAFPRSLAPPSGSCRSTRERVTCTMCQMSTPWWLWVATRKCRTSIWRTGTRTCPDCVCVLIHHHAQRHTQRRFCLQAATVCMHTCTHPYTHRNSACFTPP
jgi:hypothetical protein